MPVREFVERDVPQVVTLYWKFMLPRSGEIPNELYTAFRDLYFCNPMVDARGPSFVYEDTSGDIVGFLGVTNRRMSLRGEAIRVGYIGNFVIHPSARSGLAAPGLLGAFVAGNQDLLLTDSANDITRHLLQRLAFKTIPALNIRWMRPLSLAQCAVYAASRGMNRALASSIRIATKPFSRIMDHLTRKLLNPGPVSKTPLHPEELSLGTLLRCLSELQKSYSLWPEYDAQSLQWVLQFMRRNQKRGTLRCIALRDETSSIVGWYLYHSRPGAVGEVVQVGGQSDVFKTILEHLFQDAREQEVIALQGVADYRRLGDFSDKGCYFTCRGGWVVAHPRRPELLEILQRGDALLTRLDGEWCLSPGI
jgi:hypothetical protein